MQELNLFKIEGSVGGNQDWFRDFWMKKGGIILFDRDSNEHK